MLLALSGVTFAPPGRSVQAHEPAMTFAPQFLGLWPLTRWERKVSGTLVRSHVDLRDPSPESCGSQKPDCPFSAVRRKLRISLVEMAARAGIEPATK